MVPENKPNKRYNKLTLLAFKLIAILHNTLLATFIKLLQTVSKASLRIDRRTAVTCSWIATTSAKRAPFMMLYRRVNRKKSTHHSALNWCPEAPDQGNTLFGRLFVSLHEKHHERRTFLQIWRQSKNV
jgi:hypothetical protein